MQTPPSSAETERHHRLCLAVSPHAARLPRVQCAVTQALQDLLGTPQADDDQSVAEKALCILDGYH